MLKTPPASVLLKKAAGVPKGSAQLEKVGSITKEQLVVSAPNAQLCDIQKKKKVTKVLVFFYYFPHLESSSPVQRRLLIIPFSSFPVQQEIATTKMPDLNALKLESAMRIVAGTAANMGITIEGWDMEESKQGWREEKASKYGMDPKEFVV